MAVGEGIQTLLTEGLGPINLAFVGGSFIILSVVIALAGCIISWWRVRPAGILLVLTFIGLITAGILAESKKEAKQVVEEARGKAKKED